MYDITITSSDTHELNGHIWEIKDPKAVVVIVHGMAEHCTRYDRFAKVLNSNGYAAIAIDLRGHGRTAKGNINGYFAKKNGWKIVLNDIKLLIQKAKQEFPNVPVVLFGHSMGSIFARASMMNYGNEFDACILSGVTISKKGLRDIAPTMTTIFSIFGENKPSKMLDSMSFGAFNNAFKPSRTDFDWLSRDEEEVDKYVTDEMCGFVCTPSLFKDVAKTILYSLKKKNIQKIPKDMNIYIISGENDPCGSDGYDAQYLCNIYKQEDLNVECKIYEEARHELLNEKNRDEVTNDILSYLEKIIE
ncbi:MAG: alpha/beta hydrolase [Clostridiales bacterium]|nr:alpha/beta hydrolase [Clostridiales bacterium]